MATITVIATTVMSILRKQINMEACETSLSIKYPIIR